MHNLNYRSYLDAGKTHYSRNLWKRTSASAGKDGCELVHTRNNNCAASLSILKWDTEFFGYPVYRVDNLFYKSPAGLNRGIKELSARIEDDLRRKSARFAIFRLSTDTFKTVNILQRAGWNIVDNLNIYTYDNGHRPLKNSPAGVSVSSSVSDARLQSFFGDSREMFSASRLYQDPEIPAKTADAFYRRLFSHVVRSNQAERAVIYSNTLPAGFIVGEYERIAGTSLVTAILWMIYIKPEFRNRGLSARLLEWFFRNAGSKADFIEIGTQQNNLPANRLYQSMGCTLKNTAMTLHKWFQ